MRGRVPRMNVSLTDYWMGRDSKYRGEWTQEVQRNADILLALVNALLERMDGQVQFEKHPNGTLVSSGWRPLPVNGAIHTAAPKSKHITGQAIDLYDPEGEIDQWCMDHLEALEDIGLWLEHPAATKGWSHLQSIPPKSQNRVFYP